jgi:hypothetical protein
LYSSLASSPSPSLHFQESMQLFTFLGYMGKVTYNDVGQEEYEAEFWALY